MMSLFSKFLFSKPAHLQQGEKSEQQACQFLQKQGLKLLCRNYSCKMGELDLIMEDNKTLVIIEVRYRRNDKYGSGAETVTFKKQARIIATTQLYLLHHKINQPVRFDVISLSGTDNKVNWIKNAFQAPS